MKRRVIGQVASKRFVLANTYPMDEAYRLWQQGTYPEHHLWGVSRLSGAYDVSYAPIAAKSGAEGFLRRVGLTRNVRSQLLCAWKYRHADWFYGGSFGIVRALAILHRIGFFRPRIAALLHHRHAGNAIDRFALRGVDVLLCLSDLARKDVQAHCPELDGRLHLLGWAVDIGFYDRWKSKEEAGKPPVMQVIAAGKDHRDYETLVSGVTLCETELHLDVYCSSDVSPRTVDSRVRVAEAGTGQNVISMQELVALYSHADVIAIPLVAADRVAGLTSLLDALALGKPVVMTRNPGVDIDIAAIGCGIWIDTGDRNGWAAALTYLAEHPEERQAMGRRARAYAERELDLAKYGARIESIIATAAS